MDNEQKLLLMRKDALQYLEKSKIILRAITHNSPIGILESWLKSRRLIDPAVFISRALSTLESKLFGEREFDIATLAGAAAAISDDFIDNKKQIPYKRIALLQRHEKSRGEYDLLRLFDKFNHTLLERLPRRFQQQYKNLIVGYNKAQRDSKKLLEERTTIGEIQDIKDRAGGYSILLLYAMMMAGDLEKKDKEYSSKSEKEKFSALYAFGAWLSKIDDLWDEQKDREKGMKQLATEGIITWQMLSEETEKVKEKLRKGFQAKNVDDMFKQHYIHLMDESLFRKYGVKR